MDRPDPGRPQRGSHLRRVGVLGIARDACDGQGPPKSRRRRTGPTARCATDPQAARVRSPGDAGRDRRQGGPPTRDVGHVEGAGRAVTQHGFRRSRNDCTRADRGDVTTVGTSAVDTATVRATEHTRAKHTHAAPPCADDSAAARTDVNRSIRVAMTTPAATQALTRSRAGRAALVAVSTGVSGVLVGTAAQAVAGNRMAPWIIGRASGICAYLLLVALTVLGLVLSHPQRARIPGSNAVGRIRLHVALATFTLVFVALHVAVLATDRYAHVGWWGTVLPMGAGYRPVATTLGVVAFWSGLAAGVTAVFAGRLTTRLWWPIHKAAAVCVVLAFLHGILGGGDTAALTLMYAVTGLLVVAAAASRYLARTPASNMNQTIR